MTLFERTACRVADWFATPTALVLVPTVCIAWLLAGFSVDVLTLILSIVAITMTQLVLVGQRTGERAMQHKLDELVIAVPGADNEVAGEEQSHD